MNSQSRAAFAAVVFVFASLAAPAAQATKANSYFNTHGLGYVQTGNQAGRVVRFGSGATAMDAYVVAPRGGAAPRAAVVLFSDIYGWTLNNTRLWADRLAQAGFLAVLPDFFRGDALTDATRGTIGAWRLRHPNGRVLRDYAEVVVPGVRRLYPSVTKIGVEGFCWGGAFAVLLTGAQPPRADAAVGYHISLVTPADLSASIGPLSLQQSDPKLDGQVNATLYAFITKEFAAKRAKGEPVYVTSYASMPHGYSLRGQMGDAATKAASDTAFDAGVAFLRKYLLAAPARANASDDATAAAAVADEAPAAATTTPTTAAAQPATAAQPAATPAATTAPAATTSGARAAPAATATTAPAPATTARPSASGLSSSGAGGSSAVAAGGN